MYDRFPVRLSHFDNIPKDYETRYKDPRQTNCGIGKSNLKTVFFRFSNSEFVVSNTGFFSNFPEIRFSGAGNPFYSKMYLKYYNFTVFNGIRAPNTISGL